MQYALLYLTFLALYIVTTTLDVQWNQRVSREALYGGSGGRVITRIVLQALMLMLDTVFLMVEVRSVIRRGPGRYLSGKLLGLTDVAIEMIGWSIRLAKATPFLRDQYSWSIIGIERQDARTHEHKTPFNRWVRLCS